MSDNKKLVLVFQINAGSEEKNQEVLNEVVGLADHYNVTVSKWPFNKDGMLAVSVKDENVPCVLSELQGLGVDDVCAVDVDFSKADLNDVLESRGIRLELNK